MPKAQRKRLPTLNKVAADVVFTYKRPEELRRYVTQQGYILPRTSTQLSMKQQRMLAQAIKRARHLALLPYTQTL